MKRKILILMSASASIMACSALAQNTLDPKMDETQSSREGMTQTRWLNLRLGELAAG